MPAPSLHPALHTPLVDILGCEVPIIAAGMGGVARHQLAAAVSNAGGYGCLGMVREPPARIRAEVSAYRALSERPFAVNLIPAATDRALLRRQIETCLELRVPALALFWDVDTALVRELQQHDVLVLHQIGSRRDAELALAAGTDVLIAQGVEAGGHVRGLTSSFALLPEIVALSPVPVVACGGIASGDAVVAALALGAQGVSCGSAFLATHEANVHPHHQQRLLAARADDTLLTERFFRNWPMPATVRVLANAVTRGEYDGSERPGEVTVIGQQDDAPVPLFSTDSPLRDASGRVDDMAIYAGQSCGQIDAVCSAAERLAQLLAQATACLERLHGPGTAASPPAKPATVAPALAELLQTLLSAERAGARVAARSLRDAQNTAQRQLIAQIHRGEADSCRRLRTCLLALGLEPNREIGAFHDQAMAIADLEQRLRFIDRGQAWVIRKIRDCLPGCADARVRAELQAILETHEINSRAAAVHVQQQTPVGG